MLKMSDKKLHIVSFDIPFPADYGGVIDVFYRIKALHEIGFDITLHCFKYGKRTPQKELEKYCSTIHYYPRKKSFLSIFSKVPLIVETRKTPNLLANLDKDNAPILFVGIHSCGFLDENSLRNRLKFARMYRVEHDYYTTLAKNEDGWEKFFFAREAKKLKAFLPILQHAQHLLAIQENDYSFFKKIHPSVFLLPISVPELKITQPMITDNYCLFHGNLSEVDNTNSVAWLIENVKELQHKRFIVAGKNPSREFINFCQMKEVVIVPNPSEEELQKLIQSARIHLLYTEQSTGIKLKLLSALFSSGKVIVNPKMIEGTNLSYHVDIAKNGEEYSRKIKAEMRNKLSENDIKKRWKTIKEEFEVVKNLKILEALINNN